MARFALAIFRLKAGRSNYFATPPFAYMNAVKNIHFTKKNEMPLKNAAQYVTEDKYVEDPQDPSIVRFLHYMCRFFIQKTSVR